MVRINLLRFQQLTSTRFTFFKPLRVSDFLFDLSDDAVCVSVMQANSNTNTDTKAQLMHHERVLIRHVMSDMFQDHMHVQSVSCTDTHIQSHKTPSGDNL